MSNCEEISSQAIAQPHRVRAAAHHQSSIQNHAKLGLESFVVSWMEIHPWRLLGLCAGIAGVIGYRIGIRP